MANADGLVRSVECITTVVTMSEGLMESDVMSKNSNDSGLAPYLVHGACRGADVICAAAAETLGFEVRSYPADWEKHGRAAEAIRNQLMLDEENKEGEPIDVCLAFHNNLEIARGRLTWSLVSRRPELSGS